jgi:hypothetical protein
MAKRYIEDDAGDIRVALEEHILTWDGVTKRKMFGCPSYMADGTLFAMVVTGAIVLTHLDPQSRVTLASIAKVEPFKAGRKLIHKWAQVCVDHPSQIAAIVPYVHESYEAALTLHAD